jgi:hypothetical protein
MKDLLRIPGLFDPEKLLDLLKAIRNPPKPPSPSPVPDPGPLPGTVTVPIWVILGLVMVLWLILGGKSK